MFRSLALILIFAAATAREALMSVAAKQLGEPPRKVAERILAKLDVNDLCEPPQIAGPGFINFRLDDGPRRRQGWRRRPSRSFACSAVSELRFSAS